MSDLEIVVAEFHQKYDMALDAAIHDLKQLPAETGNSFNAPYLLLLLQDLKNVHADNPRKLTRIARRYDDGVKMEALLYQDGDTAYRFLEEACLHPLMAEKARILKALDETILERHKDAAGIVDKATLVRLLHPGEKQLLDTAKTLSKLQLQKSDLVQLSEAIDQKIVEEETADLRIAEWLSNLPPLTQEQLANASSEEHTKHLQDTIARAEERVLRVANKGFHLRYDERLIEVSNQCQEASLKISLAGEEMHVSDILDRLRDNALSQDAPNEAATEREFALIHRVKQKLDVQVRHFEGNDDAMDNGMWRTYRAAQQVSALFAQMLTERGDELADAIVRQSPLPATEVFGPKKKVNAPSEHAPTVIETKGSVPVGKVQALDPEFLDFVRNGRQ